MERFCSKCGTLVSGDGTFCPNCGAPMENAVNLNKSSDPVQPQPVQPSTYGMNNLNSANNAPMPNYPQSYNPVPEPMQEMSTKSWVGTILLTSCLGLISIILLFVWAFGDTPQPKKNYCRGMLIVDAILFGIGILYIILVFACVGSACSGMGDLLGYY